MTSLGAPVLQAPKAPAKVNLPHPWAGCSVFYWRVTNQATGEISPLPALLLAPTRGTDGAWDLNFWRLNHMQGRQQVKFSDTPKAGCWTWAAEGPPKQPQVRVPQRSKEGQADR